MITVTAFKWVPPFAAGQVRDHRVRWMLNEIGWDYEVDLIDPAVQASLAYLAEQPFGQVPVLRETGRPTLFESGAIVLDLAERSGKLWPSDREAQAQVRAWVIAALNSVEPYLSNVAEVDFFIDDERLRTLRRPGAVAAATRRLGKLSLALGERDYLVGGAFTSADLMLASVLRVAEHADLLAAYSNLSAYRARCLDRPAARKAIADQRRDIDGHGPEDMGWDPAMFTERRALSDETAETQSRETRMEPTIYLFFKGDCLEAMTRYAEILGGEIVSVFRNRDAPDPESRMPGGDDMVMNMSMKLGSATVMASDAPESMYSRPQGFRVSIAPPSREAFDRVHAALAQGAQSVEMSPGETFWAERFAMFTDRYGTPWMLNLEGNRAQG